MRCIAVLGPSQTGKTTLVDRLAELDGKPQRVSTPDGLDLVGFSYLDERWVALDCPGSIEAICHTHDALLAADAAVVCVSCDPDAAVLAAPYLRATTRAGLPTFLFVSRIDDPRGRVRDVIAALQDYAEHPIVLRQIPIREGGQIVGAVDLISERAWRFRSGQHSDLIEVPDSALEREAEARSELLESFSEFDDWLLEELIEDRQPAAGAVYAIAAREVASLDIVPAFLGSALKANGITRLMKALRHEVPTSDAARSRLAAATDDELGSAPVAVALHAHVRQHAGKAVILRAFTDDLRQGQPLAGANLAVLVDPFQEKGAANGFEAGAVAMALKSDHLHAGLACTPKKSAQPHALIEQVQPMHARVLIAQNDRDAAKLATALEKLAEEDPGMTITHEPGTGRPIAEVQGPLAMRALGQMLSEVFGVAVKEAMPQATFRETITGGVEVHYRHRKQTGGAGQFADVKLHVRPNARGEGFTFEEKIKGGTVPSNYIPAVEAGAREAMDEGPLGFPVVDVHVTLLDGQYHSVDSSDFAFRTAGRMGVREALEQATPVLLQPIHQIDVHVPSVYSGALVPLVSSLHGQVLSFNRDPEAKGWDLFRALLPERLLEGFGPSLRSATQGLAYYEHALDHFEELYGREADQARQAAGKA